MTTSIYETYRVTFDQVQACERIGSTPSRPAYYVVASSKNDGTEYRVEYNRVVKALTCNCLAGQNGNGCWHRRAAQAHADEYRTNRRLLQEKEQAQAVQEIACELVEIGEDKLNRLQAEKQEHKAVKASGENAYNRKPFQFMR